MMHCVHFILWFKSNCWEWNKFRWLKCFHTEKYVKIAVQQGLWQRKETVLSYNNKIRLVTHKLSETLLIQNQLHIKSILNSLLVLKTISLGSALHVHFCFFSIIFLYCNLKLLPISLTHFCFLLAKNLSFTH